jgi:hypothetical protein
VSASALRATPGRSTTAAVRPQELAGIGTEPLVLGRRSRWSTDRSVATLLVFAGAGSIALYLRVVGHRVFYPYELQWMEGGSVELVHRLVHGRSLYTSPTLRFTPWPYPPLYYAISSSVARIVGVGFLPLRLVSVASSIGVLGAIFLLVLRETGDRAAATFSAGLYAATFRLAGAWADIGRVDSLWLLLCLCALLAARQASSWRHGVVVGATFFLASFTKQDGLIVAVPVIAWLLMTRRRAGAGALASLALLLGASTIALNALTHGWYGFYVFRELLGQPLAGGEVSDFWLHDLLTPLPVVAVLAIVGCVATLRAARRVPSASGTAVIAGAIGLLAAGWAGRLHSGGYANVLMPAYAAMALLAGIGTSWVRRRPRNQARTGPRLTVSASLVVALAWQLAHIAYPMSAQIPARADARAADQFVALVQHLPGRVVVLIHPWYATLAGKGDFAAGAAVQDLLRSRPSAARRALIQDETQALLAPDIGAVILDQAPDPILRPQLDAAYTAAPGPATVGASFFPVTDLRLRPAFIYIRNPAR